MITMHKDQTPKLDRQLVEATHRISVLSAISAIATNAITNTGGAK